MAEFINIVAGLLVSVLVSMAVVGGVVLVVCATLFGGCCWWFRRRARSHAADGERP
jgi:hypothetical protein